MDFTKKGFLLRGWASEWDRDALTDSFQSISLGEAGFERWLLMQVDSLGLLTDWSRLRVENPQQ
jgi:hypothetical protein